MIWDTSSLACTHAAKKWNLRIFVAHIPLHMSARPISSVCEPVSPMKRLGGHATRTFFSPQEKSMFTAPRWAQTRSARASPPSLQAAVLARERTATEGAHSEAVARLLEPHGLPDARERDVLPPLEAHVQHPPRVEALLHLHAHGAHVGQGRHEGDAAVLPWEAEAEDAHRLGVLVELVEPGADVPRDDQPQVQGEGEARDAVEGHDQPLGEEHNLGRVQKRDAVVKGQAWWVRARKREALRAHILCFTYALMPVMRNPDAPPVTMDAQLRGA